MREPLTRPDEGFRPSDSQWRYLLACIDPEVAPTVTARAQAAGIDRGTFYRWYAQPGFEDWLNDQMERWHQRALAEVYVHLRRAVARGDVAAIRLYLERFDPRYRQPDLIDPSPPIQIIVSQPEMLEKGGLLALALQQQETRQIESGQRQELIPYILINEEDKNAVRLKG